MHGRVLVGLALLLTAGVAASGAAPGGPAPASRHHEVDLTSHVTMTAPGQAEPVTMDLTLALRYRVDPRPMGVAVAVTAMTMDMTGDKLPSSHTELSRNRMSDRRGGQKAEYTRDTAPPPIRAVLDTFGETLAEVALDDEGREVGRTPRLTTGPLAQPGMVDMTRAFHVRFPRDEDRWEAQVVLPQAQGQVARGTLAFEKLPRPEGAGEDDPVRVKVSGTLGSDANLRGVRVRDFAFKVDGEQVYDPKVRDWSSAAWDVVMSWEMVRDGKPFGAASGTMNLTMERTEPPPPAGTSTGGRGTGR